MAFVELELKTPTCGMNPPPGYIAAALGINLPQENCRQIRRSEGDRHIGLHWQVDVEEITRYIELPFAKSPKLRRVMAVIVADAILSARKKPPVSGYIIHAEKGWWQEASRYFGTDFSYTTVVTAVDALLTAGILIDHDLRPPSPATGIQSSYRPSPWLESVNLSKVRQHPGELIRLKNTAKVLVDYKDTERTHRERKFLEKINRMYENADIRLDSPNAACDGDLIHFAEHTVDTSKRSLYRVYNNSSWTAGGRFYGPWWQSCPSDDRKHILIDGERTEEKDFPALHPKLLYAYANEALDGDAYTLPGWERKICKRAFNVLLNAGDLPAAEGAMLEHVGGCKLAARQLIDDIKARHPKVRQYFHTGIGLWLQNIDAGMCRTILSEMCIKKGILVLPVHDSFIVPHRSVDDLNKVRWAAFDRAVSTVANK